MKYKSKAILVSFILALLFTQQTNAQSDSILIKLLKENSLPISIENKELKGSGATFLHEQAAKAHYFLIGEQHGIAEIPAFTANLLRGIDSLGYAYYATEVGPITSQIMAKKINNGNAADGIQDLLKQFPSAIPFFSWKNEAEVLEVLKEQGSLQSHFWGLDQEFIVSARMLLSALVDLAESESEKKVANKYYNQALESFKEAVETKVPRVFLSSATEEDYKALEEAFIQSKKGLEIIEEMKRSQSIYSQFMVQRKGYESNVNRSQLIKEHFLAYYNLIDTIDTKNKVLIKLGAMHCYKGINPLGIADIGNFISEFALVKKQKSFHLYMLAATGKQNSYNLMSRSEADKNKAFDYSNEPEYAAIIKASNGEARVFNLVALRKLLFKKKITNIDEGLKRIIYGYDAFLVLPKATAAINYD